MAPPVDDLPSRTAGARLADLAAATPGRGAFALRLAATCVLTTWVAQIYQTPDIALSAYIVFFMTKPDRTGSVVAALALTIVVSLVIGLLLLVAAHALDRPPLRVAAMAGLSLLMLFLGSASKLKPLASTIALVLAYALDVLGRVPEGELATRGLLYAWLFVGIPAGVAIVVNMIAGPSPKNLVEEAIAGRLRAAQALLARPGSGSAARVAALRRQGRAAMLGLLRFAILEQTAPRPHLHALRQSIASADTLLMLTEALDRRPDLPIGWRRAAAGTLGEMAAIFETHRYPVGIEPVAPAGAIAPSGPTGLLTTDFDAVLAAFTRIAPADGSPAADGSLAAEPQKGGFFLPDAFTNPVHVQHAIKTTFAAMCCYLFYALADWPGIHTCLITCYIVALDTTAETIEKLLLRVVGALAGASVGLAAIVWLTPHIDRIGGLLALVFGAALAGGWIAGGGPRIAYAGFQFSFAVFLCVIQGTAPDFDLTVARDRVIGILIGNAAIYLVFTTIWPISIAHRVDPAIARLCRSLSSIARRPDRAARRDALAAAHGAAAIVTTDLELARFEPRGTRPDRGWFDHRAAMLSRLARSESALLLAEDRVALETEATDLDALADAVERGAEIRPGASPPEQALAR